MARHITVKASELRQGDLIRIGKSENYILAYEIIRNGRQVGVWAYDGSHKAEYGPALHFKASDNVFLSMRDLIR